MLLNYFCLFLFEFALNCSFAKRHALNTTTAEEEGKGNVFILLLCESFSMVIREKRKNELAPKRLHSMAVTSEMKREILNKVNRE